MVPLHSDPASLPAPAPARGAVALGFEPVGRCFADQLAAGLETGASLSVYHRGRQVVDLWGGLADRGTSAPWARNTRIVLFSVTKGFAAMALHLLADRGQLEWDASVADVWPEFAAAGKGDITIETLVQHRAGLPFVDAPLTLADCCAPERAADIRRILEEQAPAWTPGTDQGYHALTFGLYVAELFERLAGEPMGPFLRRELFEPTGSDVYLGTPASEDERFAELYPPAVPGRLARMVGAALFDPRSQDGRMARATFARDSLARKALLNPSVGRAGVHAYNEPPVRRTALAWASATGSADGVARAYLPFASMGLLGDRRLLQRDTLTPVLERRSWVESDRVLCKPLGWSRGFLKEERHLFSPNAESFGHAGLGGALGWCDPVQDVALGYALNRLSWRVRSPRAVALCRALYGCEPLLGHTKRSPSPASAPPAA